MIIFSREESVVLTLTYVTKKLDSFKRKFSTPEHNVNLYILRMILDGLSKENKLCAGRHL